jgi:hypothetical protein
MKITLDDYFGRHSSTWKPSDEVRANALDLLSKVNAMLTDMDLEEAREPKVNSGWRPQAYNAMIPSAAVNSKHITGQAIDLYDPDGALDDFLMAHPQRLIDHGLWMEHPAATKGWTHVQSIPPRSGNRVFFP